MTCLTNTAKLFEVNIRTDTLEQEAPSLYDSYAWFIIQFIILEVYTFQREDIV